MCDTSSLKGKGVKGADQVTWDVSGGSESKIKRNCTYATNSS